MAVAYQTAHSAHQGAARAGGGPGDSLAPLLEGARARGVADAFALCGQPAILMGGAGDVLHVGHGAQALLGEGLSLRAGRLAPRGQGAGRFGARLEAALAGVAQGNHEPLTLEAAGGGAMRVRILPFEGGQGNLAQLLKAVVLLERVV